jgi:hypothetical protein
MAKPRTKAKTAKDKKASTVANVANVANAETVDHTVTQEDLDANPELVEQGIAVGEVIQILAPEDAEDAREAAAAANGLDAPKKGSRSVDVLRGSEYVRTYSSAVHGEGFLELAKELASKDEAYKLVDSEGVKVIVVSYRKTDRKTGVSSDEAKSFSAATHGAAFKSAAVVFKNDVKGSASVK